MEQAVATQVNDSDFGQKDFYLILEIIRNYFDGLHQGDVNKLKGIFHSDAYLKAPGQRRSLREWLDSVARRPIPKEQGDRYDFKVLSIEVIKDQAMVKLECPLFDFFYVDYLGLLKENGQWLVVNKMYTDVGVDSK